MYEKIDVDGEQIRCDNMHMMSDEWIPRVGPIIIYYQRRHTPRGRTRDIKPVLRIRRRNG